MWIIATKRITVRVLIHVTLLLMVLSGTSRVLGCECVASGSPEAQAEASAAVFVGEVVDRSSIERPLGNDNMAMGNRLRFRVLDMIKPPKGSLDQLEIVTGIGGGDCGLVARKGSFLLIYASRSEETGELETNICKRSAPVLCAREDLRKLGRRNPPYLKEAMASLEETGRLPCVGKPRLRSEDNLRWPEALQSQSAPSYPLVVKLTLTLNESGKVLNIHIDEILPESEFTEFRQEVLQKVRQWKFRPATYQGRAVPVTTSWVLVRPESDMPANTAAPSGPESSASWPLSSVAVGGGEPTDSGTLEELRAFIGYRVRRVRVRL